MKNTTNGPFTASSPIILASGSPRRRELLSDLGLEFTVEPSSAEEPLPNPGEKPLEYVLRMAEMKTLDVARNHQGMTILGADTIVVLENRIMGKPSGKLDALDMLTALSGQTHQVVTGFCLVLPDGSRLSRAVSTDVDMRVSTEAELMGYIETGEPMDKAGAYAIQGIGTFLVTAIRGSYTNVVGLPLSRVLDALLSQGIAVTRY
ncbi:Maf family protein [Pseudodesulfovibrio portus]|uniref:dTTP/UTP pyrophosphatase n=1 Tax=Pseudodesulfovibrio portus TaxID=231439 RepID=A0ABM8AN50_9BACT|nr:Maf family protein [Pseudodesulfovibrio portus]BDQ32810.1 Maf-like protein [Pseudodesulfovibrio portus]